jgi:hypothetical protein
LFSRVARCAALDAHVAVSAKLAESEQLAQQQAAQLQQADERCDDLRAQLVGPFVGAPSCMSFAWVSRHSLL